MRTISDGRRAKDVGIVQRQLAVEQRERRVDRAHRRLLLRLDHAAPSSRSVSRVHRLGVQEVLLHQRLDRRLDRALHALVVPTAADAETAAARSPPAPRRSADPACAWRRSARPCAPRERSGARRRAPAPGAGWPARRSPGRRSRARESAPWPPTARRADRDSRPARSSRSARAGTRCRRSARGARSSPSVSRLDDAVDVAIEEARHLARELVPDGPIAVEEAGVEQRGAGGQVLARQLDRLLDACARRGRPPCFRSHSG